jgi:hypothetical protein
MKKLHPLCELFPRMSEEEFDRLKKSIKENGLLESITLHRSGSILDGRGREEACEEVGVNQRYSTFKGDDAAAASFVAAKNIARRHLTKSQCTALAVESLDWYKAQAKVRQAEGRKRGASEGGKAGGRGRPKKDSLPGKNSGKAIDSSGEAAAQAARDFQTNAKYVAQAAKIKEKDPTTFAKIKAGTVTVSKAAREMKEKEVDRKQALELKEVNWSAEVRKFKRDASSVDKKVKAIESDCVDLVARFNDIRAYVDKKEVQELYNDSLLPLYESFTRGAAQFEPKPV